MQMYRNERCLNAWHMRMQTVFLCLSKDIESHSLKQRHCDTIIYYPLPSIRVGLILPTLVCLVGVYGGSRDFVKSVLFLCTYTETLK